jgi:HlyD family secretion protein
MKGKVRLVGDFPVTPQGVMAVVANQSLANELLEDGSKIEVRALLIENAATTSGFSWSSSNGPPFKIESGTRVAMSVVVERRRPYTYILPILKSAVGVS